MYKFLVIKYQIAEFVDVIQHIAPECSLLRVLDPKFQGWSQYWRVGQ